MQPIPEPSPIQLRQGLQAQLDHQRKLIERLTQRADSHDIELENIRNALASSQHRHRAAPDMLSWEEVWASHRDVAIDMLDSQWRPGNSETRYFIDSCPGCDRQQSLFTRNGRHCVVCIRIRDREKKETTP